MAPSNQQAQSHTTLGAGKDLKSSSSPNPPAEQDHLEHITQQQHIRGGGLGYLQRGRLLNPTPGSLLQPHCPQPSVPAAGHTIPTPLPRRSSDPAGLGGGKSLEESNLQQGWGGRVLRPQVRERWKK